MASAGATSSRRAMLMLRLEVTTRLLPAKKNTFTNCYYSNINYCRSTGIFMNVSIFPINQKFIYIIYSTYYNRTGLMMTYILYVDDDRKC